ncbi:MAG: flagellar biosynthesis anti-sigma factor FlgM [Syntrophobacterales bacterium]|nr:flagellar biosynthesis anti-sigma factor FlgM [Syntrophobacterales bacterium]
MDVKKIQQAQFYYGNVSNVKPSGAQKSAEEVMKVDRIQSGQVNKPPTQEPKADRVEFSTQALSAYEQSRAQKIGEIQKNIQQGTYKINPPDISNKMLQESW